MASGGRFPPGPASTGDIDPTAMHKSLLDHNEKYGKISYFNIKGKHIVSLNTIETIREALSSELLMDRPLSFAQKYILTGDIAVQPYSEEWKRLRVAMQAGIKSMEDYTESSLAAQNSEFAFLKSTMKERMGSFFDPSDIITASVTNGMLIGLVGKRFDYDHDIFRCFEKFDENGRSIYGNPTANYVLSHLPFLRNLICGYGGAFKRTQEAIEEIAGCLLNDIKKEAEGGEKTGLVYEMLRRQQDDPDITDDKIVAVILDMHIGGILTMSAALISLVYQLMCNPEVQTKLHEEIDNVVGREEQATIKHLSNMPYTEAVVLELFRQCPILPSAVPRSNEKEATVCGFLFPADTIFLPNLFGANHDVGVWPDPWKFDPTRFLHDGGRLRPEDHPTRTNLVTFGDGRRACPGETFARQRILLYFVNLFQSFEMHSDDIQPLSSGHPLKYTRDVILYPPSFTVKLKEQPVPLAKSVMVEVTEEKSTSPAFEEMAEYKK